jgi:hypothetical protein
VSLLRIREVDVLENHRVRLGLTDGAIVERDLAGLLRGPIFDAIRSDESRFREVRVEAGTLVWPNGADLCQTSSSGVVRHPWSPATPRHSRLDLHGLVTSGSRFERSFATKVSRWRLFDLSGVARAGAVHCNGSQVLFAPA